MAIDDPARLQRFRRVAQNRNIPLPDEKMATDAEIEYLRGRLNASMYLDAESWMCPSWVDLTLKGFDKEKDLIVELPNNSYRNWSLVGGVGSKRYGITDSRGLCTALADCGSLDFWVLGCDEIIFPALMGKDEAQLQLVSTEDQLYEWKIDVQSINFTRLLYHAEQDGDEFLINEVVLKNIALEESSITFYLVVRPMSVLGFEAIESLEFNSQTNHIFCNDVLALMVNTTPSAVYLLEADDASIPDVIKSPETCNDLKISSKLGLGTAILRFDVILSPAGTKTFTFISPLEVYTDRNSMVDFKPDPHNRDVSIGNWYNFTKKRGETLFPDERLNNVLTQAASSMAIQSYSVLHPLSPFSWEEKARVLLALIKTGGTEAADEISQQSIEMMRNSEIALETTLLCPFLWALLKLQGYSLQKDSVQENNTFITQLADRLLTTLSTDTPKKQWGERLDDEASPDDPEDAPLEHYSILDPEMFEELNDSLWTLAVLREGLKYFSLIDMTLLSKIKELLPLVESHTQERFNQIKAARWPRPQDPQMFDIDRAILDLLTSVVQLRIDLLDKKFLRSLCKKVSERRLVRNLWRMQGPLELFSSHLSLRIAQYHVWDKQRSLVESLLQRTLEFLSDDYLLPDFVNPRTFGGSGGAGSSVMAAADIILLLSDMLVHEEGNNLIFLAGVPIDWYSAKKPLTVNWLRTKFGRARIDIGLSANQHQIETGMENLPEEIEVHVPDSVPLRMVKAYGASIVDRAVKAKSPHLKLVPLSNDVVLTYHR